MHGDIAQAVIIIDDCIFFFAGVYDEAGGA